VSTELGAVVGGVVLKGTPPSEFVVKMDADAKCGSLHPEPVRSRNYLMDSQGGLANVFVYIKAGVGTRKYPIRTEPILLDQKGCLYSPYVLGIQVGQTLVIQNSDDTSHNVHSISKKNPEFNLAQPSKGMKTEKKFDKAEVFVKMKCDVHPWMFAFVGVVDHPYYAVTATDGIYKIAGLPDGEYTMEAVHPKAGVLGTQKIKIESQQGVRADFAVTPKV
jgi:plastocyanin